MTHKPVLLKETIASLSVKSGGVYVDGTLGRGGHALEILHVVMLIVQLLGKCQTTAIDDRSVVAIIANHIVVLAQQCGNHTLIDRETCREAQTVVLADKFRDFLLQLYVQVERSVEESATGTSGAIFVERSLCSVDNTLVARQTGISIRSEHQHFVAAHFNFCSLLSLNRAEIRVYVSLHELLRFTIMLVSFL